MTEDSSYLTDRRTRIVARLYTAGLVLGFVLLGVALLKGDAALIVIAVLVIEVMLARYGLLILGVRGALLHAALKGVTDEANRDRTAPGLQDAAEIAYEALALDDDLRTGRRLVTDRCADRQARGGHR